MNLEIANRLVALRKQHGFSQEDLAERIGVSRQAVSKWERGESSPDTDNLILISRLYQISLDQILSTGLSSEELREASLQQQSNIPAESILTPVVIPAPEPEKPKPETSLVYVTQPEPEPPKETGYSQYGRQGESGKSGGIQLDLETAYPILVAAAFVFLGIFLHLWHPGWMLFLTIPLYYCRHDLDAMVPVLVVAAYMLLGFFFRLWHPGWILFLAIPLYYTIEGSWKERLQNFFRQLP